MKSSGLLSLCLAAAVASGSARGATWRVTALDPSHLAVQCDRSDDEAAAFSYNVAERALALVKPDRAFKMATRRAVSGRKAFEDALRTGPWKIGGRTVAAHGLWKNPNGLLRLRDREGWLRPTSEARILYTIFLERDVPLAPGERAPVVVPGGPVLDFSYDPETPSPLFKVNQVGYAASASARYAYLGGWLGPLGPWKAPEGAAFALVDAATGETALQGPVARRKADPVRDGTPFCGEETCEMDLSAAPPGRYFLRIPGVGRSMDFEIGGAGDAKAFALHMSGLFAQRCGCAKTADLTPWTDEACHLSLVRGVHPPDQWEYDSRFTDDRGEKTKVTPFSVISATIGDCTERLSLPGGWHDAADYDRRPMHLRIVADLATVYLLRPENFSDSQLAVPERGNGIPDVLDEAYWGVKHLLAGQRKDGGVGTWIEGTRHPSENDRAMPSADPVRYCLSRATRSSSVEYAGVAALLARAMRRAGSPQALERADELLRSAEAAWNYAATADAGRIVAMKAKSGKKTIDVWYRENEEPPSPVFVAKAATNLHALTGDAKYAEALDGAAKTFREFVSKRAWGMSPLVLSEFGFTDVPGETYRKMADFWNKRVVREADAWLRREEGSYPYRLPWYGEKEGWVQSMSWGSVLPLKQALRFIAAHALTGDRKYLDAAHLANDYHEGCNPNGTTFTSGLGTVYPTSYLSLVSCADGVGEYVAGITPYRLVYGMPGSAQTKVWGGDKAAFSKQPFLRRWANMESQTVAASEFTVWETVGPAAAATGYLMEPGAKPDLAPRTPAADIRDLPGFWALP